MQVTLEVPEDLVPLLGSDPQVLNRTALEALALEGLRMGKLTVSQAGRLLGLSSRYQVDGFLKSKGIFLPLSASDVENDAEQALRFSS